MTIPNEPTDGLREALARLYPTGDEDPAKNPEAWDFADALLAGPLAPLLAKLWAKSTDAALAATTQATVSVLTRHTAGCACDTCDQLRFVRLPDVVVMTPDPAADEIRRALAGA